MPDGGKKIEENEIPEEVLRQIKEDPQLGFKQQVVAPTLEEKVGKAFNEVATDMHEVRGMAANAIYRNSILAERVDQILMRIQELENRSANEA